MQATAYPSPNYGPRRDGLLPELIVLHYTAMDSAQAALDRLCSPDHEVSAHYLIARDGTLFHMVEEGLRAWHAGAGLWRGQDDINSRSIGVELDNDGCSPFSEPQMTTLERLLPVMMARWQIAPDGVIAHSDMAPLRKADPGRRFDWERLAHRGLAIWSDLGRGQGQGQAQDQGQGGATADPTRFLQDAARFGYDTDSGADAVLSALRQRFRPWASGAQAGPLDTTDMALIADLATRFPVDPPTPIA